jgi:hypothetical protein
VGSSGAAFFDRAGAVVRRVVVRWVVVRLLVLVLVLVRLLAVVRRRRPGMDLPLVPRTVSGGTDGTSDGIAG